LVVKTLEEVTNLEKWTLKGDKMKIDLSNIGFWR
jgi:hypothetical protein